MKKTKTGLHIDVKGKRIEVYTNRDLQEKERREQEYKNLIVIGIILVIWVCSIVAVITGFNI